MTRPPDRRLPGWLHPALVLVTFSILGALLHWHHFGEGLKAEDSHWIRGDFFGTPLRLTQHLLLHRVCFPLFADSLDAYYVLTLGLHLINAWLVSTLYAALARGMGGARPRLAGALAGLLFLCYDHNNLSYVSAVSYQLVVLFLLCGTHGVLSYLGRGRWWAWALAVVCYGLALMTNVFALASPLFWIALELVWRGRSDVPAGARKRSALGVVLRYLLLALPLGLLLWQHGAFLRDYDGLRAAGGEPIWRTAALFSEYVLHAAAAFVAGLTGAGVSLAAPPWLAVALVYGLAGVGLWRLVRQGKDALSLPAVWTLLAVLWSGLVFFQALAARDGFSGQWRYYYNAVGLALALAWTLSWSVDRLAARLGWLQGRGGSVVLVVIMVGALAVNPGTRRWWSTGQDPGGTPHGRQRQPCAALTRVSQGQVAALAVPGADLRCRDLRGLDLTGRDLTGADLRGSRLALVRLTGARLARARLTGAHLLWAELDDAELSGAVLEDANLFGASLRRARLSGARLSSTRLAGARLQQAVLVKAVIRDADLSGARMSGADLSGADLSRALLIKSDLTKVSAGRANLGRANLMQADLRGARLRGAVLVGAELDGAVICARHRGTLKGYRGRPAWFPCAGSVPEIP